MTSEVNNWAGNLRYTAAKLYYPTSVPQIQELVSRHRTVKALGTRHSFNRIADQAEALVSLRYLDHLVELDLDPAHPTVTVEAGITYGALSRHLHRDGYALHNLASLPHIAVIGAVATATHGSGDANGNLSTAVSGLELVTADGNLVTVSRAELGDAFDGMVVALGGLGVVTKVTLDLVPTFDVRQEVVENLPHAVFRDHLDEILSSAYSVSLFTDWRAPRFNQVWFKRRVTDAVPFELRSTLHEATPATRALHPLAHLSAENCTEQLGVRGPWYDRLPHFRMDHQPSSGEELQSEYLVPRQNAWQALEAVYALRDRIAPLLMISEVRTIAADRLWMSPCYEQPCVGIHFTWQKTTEAVLEILPHIERTLAPLGARPHWGKLFRMPASQIQPLFPRLPDFRSLRNAYDPQGKFLNPFLADLLA